MKPGLATGFKNLRFSEISALSSFLYLSTHSSNPNHLSLASLIFGFNCCCCWGVGVKPSWCQLFHSSPSKLYSSLCLLLFITFLSFPFQLIFSVSCWNFDYAGYACWLSSYITHYCLEHQNRHLCAQCHSLSMRMLSTNQSYLKEINSCMF